ncbi:hypothetical protein ACF0H5_011346 [Mactra antiquata]
MEKEFKNHREQVEVKRVHSADVQRKGRLGNLKPSRPPKPSEKANKQTLEDENERLKRELERANVTIDKISKDRDQIKEDLSQVKNRLSKVLSNQITDGNSDIADLADENRPTKLAERYLQLYDNQWSDAIDSLSKHDDKTAIEMLLDILVKARQYCEEKSEKLTNSLTMDITMSTSLESFMKETPKLWPSPHPISEALTSPAIQTYIKECITVCWFMSVQDPPVELGVNIKCSDPFNTHVLKAYLVTGPILDFLVWPPLYLKVDGPLLCKGIGQGMHEPSDSSTTAHGKQWSNKSTPGGPCSNSSSLGDAATEKLVSKQDIKRKTPPLIKEKPKSLPKHVTDKQAKDTPRQNTHQSNAKSNQSRRTNKDVLLKGLKSTSV